MESKAGYERKEIFKRTRQLVSLSILDMQVIKSEMSPLIEVNEGLYEPWKFYSYYSQQGFVVVDDLQL